MVRQLNICRHERQATPEPRISKCHAYTDMLVTTQHLLITEAATASHRKQNLTKRKRSFTNVI